MKFVEACFDIARYSIFNCLAHISGETGWMSMKIFIRNVSLDKKSPLNLRSILRVTTKKGRQLF